MENETSKKEVRTDTCLLACCVKCEEEEEEELFKLIRQCSSQWSVSQSSCCCSCGGVLSCPGRTRLRARKAQQGATLKREPVCARKSQAVIAANDALRKTIVVPQREHVMPVSQVSKAEADKQRVQSSFSQCRRLLSKVGFFPSSFFPRSCRDKSESSLP